ncbi:hypothetical protein [Ralstonia sp. SET104]|uniref:hypothetical protein n=1 Tax=Ralstonia sp. SET104 TaxID=2448774 RepID=UPI000FF944DA|nr:hypothetical protein [Ralstonia sp. SET104]GCB03665.1 hypothetical protein PSUB009319_12960 [Ralstonia sp. SET104]
MSTFKVGAATFPALSGYGTDINPVAWRIVASLILGYTWLLVSLSLTCLVALLALLAWHWLKQGRT